MADQVYGYNAWGEATWIPRRLAEQCAFCDAWHVAGCFCGCPTGKRLWSARQRYTSGLLTEGANEYQRLGFARWLYEHQRIGTDDRAPDTEGGGLAVSLAAPDPLPVRTASDDRNWDESAWMPY